MKKLTDFIDVAGNEWSWNSISVEWYRDTGRDITVNGASVPGSEPAFEWIQREPEAVSTLLDEVASLRLRVRDASKLLVECSRFFNNPPLESCIKEWLS
jgi:hypothetical protein